jgi:hypothetical protein
VAVAQVLLLQLRRKRKLKWKEKLKKKKRQPKELKQGKMFLKKTLLEDVRGQVVDHFFVVQVVVLAFIMSTIDNA